MILPFLDQKALYDQFHLDEPWDSPHNRTLISKMPAVFRCPAENDALAADGKTRYLAPRAPARSSGRRARRASATSPTALRTRSSRSMPATSTRWSGPNPTTGSSTPSQGSRASSGATGPAASTWFCRRLGALLSTQTIAPATLRALLTRNGGEVIRPEDL